MKLRCTFLEVSPPTNQTEEGKQVTENTSVRIIGYIHIAGNSLGLAREIRVKVPYLGLSPEPFLGVYR